MKREVRYDHHATRPLGAAPSGDVAEQLGRVFRGQLIRPGDPGYEASRRIWNGSIDRRPGLIARCAGSTDVVSAVRAARSRGLLAAVRSGGHSFPGYSVCDGGMVIDLGLMKGINVDPESRTARVQSGVLLGELDRATQAFGMAVPSGIVTHTGVSGLTLGGGIGSLMRRYGLTIDQLLSVEVVTAEGEVVRANEAENPDLFWGVRGGGGNFGIVTEFEFRLNPVGPVVLAGPVLWAMEDSPKILRFYREWMAAAPDELTTIVVHRKAPPIPQLPAELHGKLIVIVACCYSGPVDDGESVVRALRSFGAPVVDLCGPKPFLEFQAMFDPSFLPGRWYHLRSCDIPELTDDVVEILAAGARRIHSPLSSFALFNLGGAIARVAQDDTAFSGRTAGYTVNINGCTETTSGFNQEQEWVRGLWAELEPYHTSVYVNFLMDEGKDRIRSAYGPGKYARLKALKRRYDPDNFFRLNQNIPPN
jgi:FAD/FMN-containing dehydrogenase